MAEENKDSKSVSVAAFIAALDAKIVALQNARAALIAAMGALGQAGDIPDVAATPTGIVGGDLGMPTELPEGAFMGKSVPVCVELYLSAAKRKKTNKEIAAALREGGVESNASNFENVVTGALFGLKKAGKVLRFKNGWGLSSWYPAHIRGAAPDATKRPKKKGRKARAKVKASVPVPIATATNLAEIPNAEDKPELRIINFFKSNQREVSAGDVAKALGLKIQIANLVLAKLAHQKKIEKLSSGHFKALATLAIG